LYQRIADFPSMVAVVASFSIAPEVSVSDYGALFSFCDFDVQEARSSAMQAIEPATPDGERKETPERMKLREEIRRAAHLLPAQGPISVFIHHNTLHAFEDLPFEEAVARGAETLRCQPYLSESAFREHWDRARIRDADLEAVLRDDLGDAADEPIAFSTKLDFRRALLRTGVASGSDVERDWMLAEKNALARFRPDAPPAHRRRLLESIRDWALRELPLADERSTTLSTTALLRDVLEAAPVKNIESWSTADWETFGLQTLWRVVEKGMANAPRPAAKPIPVRHRDLMFATLGIDPDVLVHEHLVPFCGAYLDQGLASWRLPGRDRGFYVAFHSLFIERDSPEVWTKGLASELRRLVHEGVEPLDCIAESLIALGVRDGEREEFLKETLLALRGFGGMMAHLLERPDRVVHPLAADSVVEFLAVRLILDRFALSYFAERHFGRPIPLGELRTRLATSPTDRESTRVFREVAVFNAAQILGWLSIDLLTLSPDDWRRIAAEVDAFHEVERRRVFHLAYERRYRVQTLDAFAAFRRAVNGDVRPRFQAVFCIDEREESVRRHLEEIAPEGETFGAAGFFGAAIYFKGVADAHFTPLCPAVMFPTHWVEEAVGDADRTEHARRRGLRKRIGDLSHRLHTESRTLTGGLLSSFVGFFAGIPLLARTLFPRLTAMMRRSAGKWLDPPRTHLVLERTAAKPSEEPDGIGYTLEEMTNVSERLLRDIGMTKAFARCIVIVGHGSVSMNNPHESAHDCGACGGGRGGPNARAVAQMLNDPRVRTGLAARGLTIPDDVRFLGSMHNTCDESMTYYDLHAIPDSHAAEFAQIREWFEEACRRNAHERCRRFESAPLSISLEAARRHVEGRSQDLSEVRPEYGHATNAACYVGRRWRTRGLYLDRRTFLVSYDATQDDDGPTILARILGAVIPVCSGISLEYYFSFVDPTGFGCGTKLPHNITSLVGVMDGAASDLRTGLPWQMVEVHEPMRLLFIIESTAAAMEKVIAGNPAVGQLCRNRWVQIAVLDPHSSKLQVYDGRRFNDYVPETSDLPTSPSSIAWYRNRREHLGYAAVVPPNA
jgi:uncharacterized protein